MRALIYYVASTIDGFIAHEDGTFDGFPVDDEVIADFFASYAWFDTVLMGRKTYEVALNEGITDPYPALKSYLFSRTIQESPDANVTLVSENAVAVVRALKQEAGKPIWLCGGADLATQLFAAHLIDEIILKLNPVVFGSGIPLFHTPIDLTQLTLTDSKVYPSGHVLLTYRVGPDRERAR